MSASFVVTARVEGVEHVVRYLSSTAPTAAIERIRSTVKRLGFMLERKVKLEKLNGVVLRRRTGRLVRSINTRFIDTPTSSTATVGTNLVYGRAWELGFTLPAMIIVPKNKKALAWPGGAHPVRRVRQNARSVLARPFLRPALAEMRGQILSELSAAVEGL